MILGGGGQPIFKKVPRSSPLRTNYQVSLLFRLESFPNHKSRKYLSFLVIVLENVKYRYKVWFNWSTHTFRVCLFNLFFAIIVLILYLGGFPDSKSKQCFNDNLFASKQVINRHAILCITCGWVVPVQWTCLWNTSKLVCKSKYAEGFHIILHYFHKICTFKDPFLLFNAFTLFSLTRNGQKFQTINGSCKIANFGCIGGTIRIIWVTTKLELYDREMCFVFNFVNVIE